MGASQLNSNNLTELAELTERANYYAGRALQYGDTPVVARGKIKAKYLEDTTNDGYEAGVANKNMKHLKITEANYPDIDPSDRPFEAVSKANELLKAVKERRNFYPNILKNKITTIDQLHKTVSELQTIKKLKKGNVKH